MGTNCNLTQVLEPRYFVNNYISNCPHPSALAPLNYTQRKFHCYSQSAGPTSADRIGSAGKSETRDVLLARKLYTRFVNWRHLLFDATPQLPGTAV